MDVNCKPSTQTEPNQQGYSFTSILVEYSRAIDEAMVDNNDNSIVNGGMERICAQDDDSCNKSSTNINDEKVAVQMTRHQNKSALTATMDPPSDSSISNNTGNRSTRKKSVGNALSKYNHQSPTRQKTHIDPMKASMTSLDCPSYLFSSTKQHASASASNNHSVRSTLPLLSSSTRNSAIEGEGIAIEEDKKGQHQHRTRKVPSTFLGSFRDSASTTTLSSPQEVQEEQQQQPTAQRTKSRLRERYNDAADSSIDDKSSVEKVDNNHPASARRSGTGTSRPKSNETNSKSILRQHRRGREVTAPSSATPTTSGNSESSTKEQNTLETDETQPAVANLPTKIEEQKLETTENPPDNTGSTASRSRVISHPRRVRSIRSNHGDSQLRNSDATYNSCHEGSNVSLDLNDALSRDPSSATETSPETIKPMPQQRLRSSKSSVTSRNGNISTNTTRQYHKSPMRQRLQHSHGTKVGNSNHTGVGPAAATTASVASSATSMTYPKSPSTGLRSSKKQTKDMSNTSLTKLSLLQKLQDLSDKTQIDCNSSIAW